MKRARFVSLIAAGLATPRAAGAQSALTVVRLGTAANEAYGLAYQGVAQGFFKAAGLDVQITSFTGAGGVMSAFAGGALDVGCANVGAQANAHIRRIPLSMIAGGALYSTTSPPTVLAVAKSAPYLTAKGFDGKTIGVSTLKDLQQASVMKWSDAGGGHSATLRFIEIPPTEMAPALTAGRIDAACLLEPSLTFALSDIRILAKCYDAIAPSLMITTHFAGNDWLEKNTMTATKLIAALRSTARWANANQAAAGLVLAKITKIPASSIGEMRRAVYADRLDVKTIQPVIDATAQYKFLPRDFAAADMFWAHAV